MCEEQEGEAYLRAHAGKFWFPKLYHSLPHRPPCTLVLPKVGWACVQQAVEETASMSCFTVYKAFVPALRHGTPDSQNVAKERECGPSGCQPAAGEVG